MSVTIPDGVTSIGDYAFYNCYALTSINIPNSVTSIRSSAFSSCSALTSITIPDSVTSIGDWAFQFCKALTSITVDPANTVYKSDGNCIIEKATNKLIQGCKASIIPNYVTSIGSSAFNGYSSLISINIPDGVTSIGDRAFDFCTALTSITIPNSVISIGSYAFHDCRALTNVIIKGKPTVKTTTFDSTPKLEKIYVLEGKGYSPTDTIDGKPIDILPANGAVVAKTMTVKSMAIS